MVSCANSPHSSNDMPKVVTEDAWEREQDSDASTRDSTPEPPRTRRKVDMVFDEAVEAEVSDAYRRSKTIRGVRLRPGLDDDDVWAEAKKRKAVLVSLDRKDFYSERKYPIQTCPGLIVLAGRTAAEHAQAFRHALAKVEVITEHQIWGSSRDMKIRASPGGAVQVKRFIEGRIVVDNY